MSRDVYQETVWGNRMSGILVSSEWVYLVATLAQVLLKIVIWMSRHMLLHVWCTVVWFTCQGIITLCPGMPKIQINSVQMSQEGTLITKKPLLFILQWWNMSDKGLSTWQDFNPLRRRGSNLHYIHHYSMQSTGHI